MSLAANLINVHGLEAVIQTVVQSNKELSAHVQRLETTLMTLATKEELADRHQAITDALAGQERQIAQLDIANKAAQPILEEMPQAQQEIVERMIELERRLHADVHNATFSLIGRVKALETDIRARASVTDLRKLSSEVEERVKREEIRSLRDQIIQVRDHASERIDDIGERTYNMRREMEDRLLELRTESELLQKGVNERNARLEEQSREVATFIARADRSLNSKATAEELHQLRTMFVGQLEASQAMLEAQLSSVRERAETVYNEFKEVWKGLRSVALKKELDPVSG